MKSLYQTCLIFILAIASAPSFGQVTANEAIKTLKEGALVVKLIIPEKRIEMLLKQNNKEEAIRLEEATAALNQELITAFSNAYTYGPLYFVYSSDMHLLVEGDPGVLFDKQGEFATAYPKDWLYIELSESPELNIDGFVVRDRNNDALTKPFPYFTSQWGFLRLSKKSFVAMIEEWQNRLRKVENRL
jgi:hypothetical protein